MFHPTFVAIRHLVAHGLERFSHKIFVRVWAIPLGGIEERDACSDGGPDDRDAVRAAARASVALADAHTAETESRNLEAAFA